ncbi:hypothetical protein [Microbacterium sp.]|uniref:hypothetical protein n=1 Tax=Microbacterium sp. TaxID=51671 RepID=UPI003F95232F
MVAAFISGAQLNMSITMPSSLREASEPHEQAEGRGKWFWRVLAVISPLATIVLYWYISLTAIAPRTGYDENHLLQMARLISGDDNVTQLAGSGYYPGWAVILAPIWWFTHDAATVYASAITVSNVIGVATIVPLSLIGRRLGLTWPQSITISSIVMLLPARSVHADYALSEQAITFLVVLAVLAAFALWQRPTWWRVVLFVAAVGAAYVTHPRAIALVATAGVWLLAFALRRWYLALLGLVLLAGAYFAAEHFARTIAERVLLNGYGKDGTLQNTLDNFDALLFVKVFLNQTWIQVVGTAGLFAIGCVIVVVWTIRELRVRRLGFGSFMFGAILSTMLVSAIWWTRPDILLRVEKVRLDAWTYSRYIDSVSAIIVLIALAALIRGLRLNVIATGAGVFAAGSGVVILWVARNVPLWGQTSASNATILPWRFLFPDEPFDLPLMPTFTNDARFWLWATVFVLACFVAYALLRNTPRTMAVGLLALVSALALLANLSAIRPYPADVTAAIERIESLTHGKEDQTRINFDLACRGPGIANAVNWFPFWLSPRVVEIVDRRVDEQFDSELVISCADWSDAEAFGARPYAADSDFGYGLWVLPGELQDELSAAGLLKE